MSASPPNPISNGFRAARRNLPIFLLEILWRWSFAAAAILLSYWTCNGVFAQLQIREVVLSAWRTQNYQLLGFIGISILLKPWASLLPVIVKVVGLAFALGFLWSVLAALVRRITVRRLESGRQPLGFGGMLAVQWLRAMVTVGGGLLLLTAFIGAVFFATKGTRTDTGRFYLIVVPTAVLTISIWLVVNWYLSQASIFGRGGQGLAAALREARRNLRRHTSDFAGIAFIFLLLRLVLILAALAVIGLTSSMMASAPQSYLNLVVIIVLAYCAVADFLFIARTAAYLALAAAPDPIAAEMGIVDPELPVEKSSLR
jgi:hypothetical protein